MKFAKWAFWAAGAWGVLVLTPLFFIFDIIGRQDPPAITHPGFYYGFVTAALAWQAAFLVIGANPARFRPLMIPSVLEKFGYAAAVITLHLQGRMRASDVPLGVMDLFLGILFLAAFAKTKNAEQSS